MEIKKQTFKCIIIFFYLNSLFYESSCKYFLMAAGCKSLNFLSISIFSYVGLLISTILWTGTRSSQTWYLIDFGLNNFWQPSSSFTWNVFCTSTEVIWGVIHLLFVYLRMNCKKTADFLFAILIVLKYFTPGFNTLIRIWQHHLDVS